MDLGQIILEINNEQIYRDGDRCIKVFPLDRPVSEIMTEVRNHAIVQEAGVTVPPILGVTQYDGHWAIITRYIEGERLSDLMKMHPEKMDEYMRMFVDLQMQIHSVKGRRLVSLKDEMDQRICGSDLNATTRYQLHIAIDDMFKDEKICHNNFIPINVTVTEQGEAYVMSWVSAAQGNAIGDAARSYLLIWMQQGEDDAEKYISTFCEKSGISREQVIEWTPIMAASLFTQCREKDKEFLLSWIYANNGE